MPLNNILRVSDKELWALYFGCCARKRELEEILEEGLARFPDKPMPYTTDQLDMTIRLMEYIEEVQLEKRNAQ